MYERKSTRSVRFMSARSDGLNDRMQETLPAQKRTEEERAQPEQSHGDGEMDQTARYMEELRRVISKSTAFQKAKETPTADDAGRAPVCLDASDQFTPGYLEDLHQLQERHLRDLDRLEEMAPAPDLFGVLRRQCHACPDFCIGYRAQGVVCPSPSGELDFPTFCQNCGCPGCFHPVVKSKDALPESLAASLRSYNIRQADLNFNGAMVALEILDEKTRNANIGAFVDLLKNEGIEILSTETRSLDVQEAMYLNIRQLQAKEKELDKYDAAGVDPHKAQKERQIHAPGPDVFGAAVRCDYEKLDKAANDIEITLKRKAAHILKPWRGKEQRKGGGNDSQSRRQDRSDASSRRTAARAQAARQDGPGLDEEGDNDVDQDKDAYLGPRRMSDAFKIRTQAEINRMESLGSTSTAFDEQPRARTFSHRDEQRLLATVRRSPDVRKLLLNRFLIMVVSSTVHHNVDQRMRDHVLPDYFDIVGKDEVKLAHVSQRKIEAMEDSVLFAPYLYRLQKSIILTEPADSLFGFGGRAQVRGAAQHTGPPKSSAPSHAQTMPALASPDLLGTNATRPTTPGQSAVNPGKRQAGMTKYLTRKLKGGADDEAYMMTGPPVKRDPMKDFVDAAKKQEQEPKARKGTGSTQDAEEQRLHQNFGTMVDFFDYSGVRVQAARRSQELTRPVSFGNMLLPADELREQYANLVKQLAKAEKSKVNLFAVAKVGTPNMIFPTTLDVQMRNFQDPHHYIQIADYFFPENSKNQMTVVILRPLIVRNHLNDLFVEILKANDFLIVKRSIRTFTQEQAMKIWKMENLTKDNAELYRDTVMAGPSEIVIMSKVGAIQDAKTICSGSLTGRRRSNQTGDSGQGPRNNVDSLSAMFEIAPFSSFNEFLDLEDFLVEHSRIFNYKKIAKDNSDMDRVDALNFQKAMEIRVLLNSFTRSAKLAAVAAQTEQDVRMMIDMFDPSLGQLEELILVLNPLYNPLIRAVEELLVRMQYNFVHKRQVELNSEDVKDLLQDKFPMESRKTQMLLQIMEFQDPKGVHFYHLTKRVAIQELQALYELSEASFEDHLVQNRKVVGERGALLAEHMPYLFLAMDSSAMFEKASELLYERAMTTYTGGDFVDGLTGNQKRKILEICLFTTTGTSTFIAIHDSKGDLVSEDRLEANLTGAKMSSLCRPPRNVVAQPGQVDRYVEEPAILPIHTFSAQGDSSVQYIVESEEHVLYEIRFHRINHREDVNPQSLKIEDQPLQGRVEGGDGRPPKKSVTIVTEQDEKDAASYRVPEGDGRTKSPIMVQKEMFYFFERFSTLNFYYAEVKRELGPGLVPSFYRFKIYPMGGETLNRVFEVEEHMGRVFMDELAEAHFRHTASQRDQNERETGEKSKKSLGEQPKKAKTGRDRRSLPSYVYGSQLAQLVKKLETVRCSGEDTLKGAGQLIYDGQQQVIRGRCQSVKNYWKYQRGEYKEMLRQLESRWHLFISKLETDLIESKLQLILGSVTFRYSRAPEHLSLIPDRLTEINLRMNQTVRILSKTYRDDPAFEETDGQEKEPRGFFEDVYDDPNRARDLRALGGALHAIAKDTKPELQPQRRLKEHLDRTQYTTQLADTLLPSRSYVIHRHPAISGVSVAMKSRHQLIASLLFLISFWLKKVDPKPHLFKIKGDGKGDSQPDAQEEYEVFLQSLEAGVIEGYGHDEINKVADLRALRQGKVSEFDAILDHKLEEQERCQLEKNEAFQKRRRRIRNDPNLTLQELIENEIRKPAEEQEKKVVSSVQQFMEQRTQGLNDDVHNKQFLDLLNRAGMKFGANVLKLADDFCTKLEIEREKKRDGKESIQEKISLVKMEYFLYAFTEAYHAHLDLIKYERMMDRFEGQVATLEQERDELSAKQARARRAGEPIMDTAAKRLSDDLKSKEMEISSKNKKVQDTRFRMSKRETELLLVFRELCNCEVHAPDECFKGDRLVSAAAIQETTKHVARPMETFWKPVHYEDDNLIPPNSEQALKYHWEEEDEVQEEPGKFIGGGLKGMRTLDSRQTKTGHEKRKVNKLRDFKKPEFDTEMKFRPLENPAYAKEKATLASMRKDLAMRTTMTTPGARQPETPAADFITPGNEPTRDKSAYVDDPFSHLRNKEQGDEVIKMAIERFYLEDAHAAQQSGLNKDQCHRLVLDVYEQLRSKKVACEEYSNTNFETSFSIYKNKGSDQVDASKLKHFLLCLAEL